MKTPPATAHSDAASKERHRLTLRSTIVSAVVNIILSTVQIFIGFVASSQALIADGLHSLSDLIGDGVTLLANHGSHKKPDEDHNYGHARYENAASLVLGLILLGAGFGILWAAINRIQLAEAMAPVSQIALWTAMVVIVAKEGLFRYLLAIAKHTGSSLLIANAWHARSDAASSLIVLIGIIGTQLGYPVLDPIAAIAVGFMIARMGWSIGWKSLSDLMDRALPPDEAEPIRATLAATPGVLRVHELRTRFMGDRPLVDAHLAVDPSISVSEGHYIAHLARSNVMKQHRALDVEVHIDPLEDIETKPETRLPLREDILKVLRPLLNQYGQWNMTLHYLNNRLVIEIALRKGMPDAAWAEAKETIQRYFGPRVSLSPFLLSSSDQ